MKIIKAFVASALTALLFAVAAQGAEYTDTLKIGLYYASSAPTSVTLWSNSVMHVSDYITKAPIAEIPAETTLTLARVGSIMAAAGYFETASVSVYVSSETPIALNGAAYRGDMLFNLAEAGMTVINVVNTEDYLQSVLGREMSPSWDAEALKAQAVCSRNYAVCNLDKHKSYGFDLCATTDCQVYSGVASESESTIAAVKATAGVVATYDGEIVPLYFFATDGGATEDVKNVWGSEAGYLKSVIDPYEDPAVATRYSWQTTISATTLTERLKARGIDIGTITDVRVDERSESGRVTALTFVGTNGEQTVLRERTRTTLGSDVCYSQNFTITKSVGAASLVSTSGEVVASPFVLSSGGVASLCASYIIGANGTLSNLTQGSADEFSLTGKGWGHGVGMSQYGALGMAKAGFGYEDILKFFFTGLELQSL
ncbi:MAG: SpoIID/LytB domain-containing protein [Clostridia bacterium]|nr:SpoIID/LytB domain-containing protein [Clostridia bacterium]